MMPSGILKPTLVNYSSLTPENLDVRTTPSSACSVPRNKSSIASKGPSNYLMLGLQPHGEQIKILRAHGH